MSELATRAKYDAFISYSHGSDLLLAEALQHDLERFARPWYRPRVTRVFRDLTNLSASPGLWSTIEKALHASSWFWNVSTSSPTGVADLSVDRSGGLRVAAPDQTGVLLWDLDIDSWQERACDIAARDLTRAEWAEYVGELLPYRPSCA